MALHYDKATRSFYTNLRPPALQDVDEPNLYRDIFPYSQFPKIPFSHERVPTTIPEETWLTDTTFRDGQQARAPYTVEQTVQLFTFLHRLAGPAGLIRQSEFFLYSQKDRQAVEKCMELGFEYPQITGWIRAVKSDFALVKDMGLKETGILTSCSDYHIFLKLRRNRREAMEMYLDIVRTALDSGIAPRCHFEDITRADFDGFVIPYAAELMKLAEQYDTPVKIRMCDTLGFGVPYVGADLPRSVAKITYYLHQQAGVPSEWLEWHGHNDFHKVLANATTAWLHGCCAANGTLLSIGERTGNPPIEGLLVEHAMLWGEGKGVDYAAITELADYYRVEIGYDIPPLYPLVGRDFNVTRAGIHADGMLKNEEIYNPFDTERILRRPPRVALTDKSGVGGVCLWVQENYELDGELAKADPRVQAIAAWIDAQYAAGRIAAMSDEEMADKVTEVFGEEARRRPETL
ncbi:MAG: 2-isopropylmalate synthase [Planctomycetes bacterium]|nr:2-isopropylmalate synthase [Planctomycetota bacterium]